MHRGGGDENDDLLVAISPPPEFQDLPAPPPTVFRDLSPTPSTKSEAHHQRLCDFASRISFNILNQAMVIATEEVVSSHHQNVSYSTPTVSSHHHHVHHHTSDSSEEEITTSWEYLPKPNPGGGSSSGRRSETKVRLRGSRPLPPLALTSSTTDDQFNNLPPPRPGQVNRSASFHLELMGGGGCCTPSPRVNLPNSVNTRCNNSRNNVGPKSASNRHSIAGTANLMESVLIHESQGEDGHNKACSLENGDIYSLPVDDISRGGTQGPLKDCLGPTSLSFQQTIGSRTSNGANNGGLATDCSDDSSAARSGSHSISNQQFGQEHRHFSAENVSDTIKRFPCPGERKDEGKVQRDDYSGSSSGQKFRNQTARRSQSVEANITNVVESHAYHLDTSRGHCEGSSSTKEKRTLGNSILNLFKRKSRSKARPENDSCPHYSGSSVATTSRALPAPPPTPAVIGTSDSEPEMEPMVRISDNQDSSFSGHMDLGPWSDDESLDGPIEAKDFTVSIEKVKDCGWYWGPLSSEAAEDLLRGEPDGAFIVRDSSDAHYIFSLTFKLNGLVRHVRIEHDQGNFSFGPLTKFRASTIVEFVEKAVAHSRSGRYLFFTIHRRPVLGPMRVQLLHPTSRFRHPRSLQHMCRFVILKYVRRDRISSLPLPKPLQEYLNTPHYYFEKHEDKKAS